MPEHGLHAPPPPPPQEEYYDEELDFLFTSDGDNFNDSNEEEALGDDNFFRPDEEEKWMWRASPFSVRSKAERRRKSAMRRWL
jgi:hypothetical protein